MARLQEKDQLEILADKLARVQEQIDDISYLFEEQDTLRAEIKEYMVENGIPKRDLDHMLLILGKRKNTEVVDYDQLIRTLRYRGVLDECLQLNMAHVRKVLGDDALGITTSETKYLIVKGK